MQRLRDAQVDATTRMVGTRKRGKPTPAALDPETVAKFERHKTQSEAGRKAQQFKKVASFFFVQSENNRIRIAFLPC